LLTEGSNGFAVRESPKTLVGFPMFCHRHFVYIITLICLHCYCRNTCK